MLNIEIEVVRENNKRLQTEYDDMESKYKRLERGMKEKDWELKDNVSLKDAKIQDLENRLKEFEGNSKRQIKDFKNKFGLVYLIDEFLFKFKFLKDRKNG